MTNLTERLLQINNELRNKRIQKIEELLTDFGENYPHDTCNMYDPSPRELAKQILDVAHGKECYFCGHIGPRVTRYALYHVGGKGECIARCCDDYDECVARVERNKQG